MTAGSHERVLLHLLYPTLRRSRIGPEEETGADGSHVDGGGTGTRVCRVRGPWHPTVQRRQPFARRPRAPILHRCPYRYPACSSSCRLTTSSEHSALAWPSEHTADRVWCPHLLRATRVRFDVQQLASVWIAFTSDGMSTPKQLNLLRPRGVSDARAGVAVSSSDGVTTSKAREPTR